LSETVVVVDAARPCGHSSFGDPPGYYDRAILWDMGHVVHAGIPRWARSPQRIRPASCPGPDSAGASLSLFLKYWRWFLGPDQRLVLSRAGERGAGAPAGRQR